MCDGLDLSLCDNLEEIDIYGGTLLLQNGVYALEKLKKLKLEPTGDTTTIFNSLKSPQGMNNVKAILNVLPTLDKLKSFGWYYLCSGIVLSSEKNL